MERLVKTQARVKEGLLASPNLVEWGQSVKVPPLTSEECGGDKWGHEDHGGHVAELHLRAAT